MAISSATRETPTQKTAKQAKCTATKGAARSQSMRSPSSAPSTTPSALTSGSAAESNQRLSDAHQRDASADGAGSTGGETIAWSHGTGRDFDIRISGRVRSPRKYDMGTDWDVGPARAICPG